jgi:hypothetical protein
MYIHKYALEAESKTCCGCEGHRICAIIVTYAVTCLECTALWIVIAVIRPYVYVLAVHIDLQSCNTDSADDILWEVISQTDILEAYE